MKGTCVPFTLPIVGKSGGAPAGAQTPRRFTNGTADVNDTVVGLTTDRGYTEHEMLDELGIIHMNGRIYDPYIGRFMSADPYIQAPYELQSHNRYAYVMNNPLLYTDPSGFNWFKKVFKFAIVAIAVVATMGAVAVALGATGATFGALMASAAATAGGWGTIIVGAAGGFAGGFLGAAANGASFKESLAAGVMGGITGAAFAWAGGIGATDSASRFLAHAAVGCGSSLASGGGASGCGRGAAAAMIGHAVTNYTAGTNQMGRFAAATVSCGVTSRVMGGTFANGAQTAAYGFLFNSVLHDVESGAGYGGRTEYTLEVGSASGDDIYNRTFIVKRNGFVLGSYQGSIDPDLLHQSNCANGCPTIASGEVDFSREYRSKFGQDVLVMGNNGRVTTAGPNPNQMGLILQLAYIRILVTKAALTQMGV